MASCDCFQRVTTYIFVLLIISTVSVSEKLYTGLKAGLMAWAVGYLVAMAVVSYASKRRVAAELLFCARGI